MKIIQQIIANLFLSLINYCGECKREATKKKCSLLDLIAEIRNYLSYFWLTTTAMLIASVVNFSLYPALFQCTIFASNSAACMLLFSSIFLNNSFLVHISWSGIIWSEGGSLIKNYKQCTHIATHIGTKMKKNQNDHLYRIKRYACRFISFIHRNGFFFLRERSFIFFCCQWTHSSLGFHLTRQQRRRHIYRKHFHHRLLLLHTYCVRCRIYRCILCCVCVCVSV